MAVCDIACENSNVEELSCDISHPVKVLVQSLWGRLDNNVKWINGATPHVPALLHQAPIQIYILWRFLENKNLASLLASPRAPCLSMMDRLAAEAYQQHGKQPILLTAGLSWTNTPALFTSSYWGRHTRRACLQHHQIEEQGMRSGGLLSTHCFESWFFLSIK